MKSAVLLGLRTLAAFSPNGRKFKHGLLALIAAGFVSITSSAHAISQLEFIQWMVQLSGDNTMFSAGSSAEDYMTWARAKGMNPTGGWSPSAALTPDQLAQALVQLYGLNPRKFNGDYFRILEREGIYIDRNTGEVSRAALASLVDEFGFQSRLFIASNSSTSKGLGWLVRQPGGNPGLDGAPPPGFQNPRNPHFGNQNPRNGNVDGARNNGNGPR